MHAQTIKSLVKLNFIWIIALLSACSSIKQYPESENPNFTLKVEKLYYPHLLNRILVSRYVELHVHIDHAKTAKKAKCVPGDRWYVGSIKKLKSDDSESISLPVGQRAYLILRQRTKDLGGSINKTKSIAFNFVPEEGKQYEFTYKQTEIAISKTFDAKQSGKKQALPINGWKSCF